MKKTFTDCAISRYLTVSDVGDDAFFHGKVQPLRAVIAGDRQILTVFFHDAMRKIRFLGSVFRCFQRETDE
jgi:hypothetical protein